MDYLRKSDRILIRYYAKNFSDNQRRNKNRRQLISGGNNNAEENQKLYNLTPQGVEKQIKIYETGGHGTDILKVHPERKNWLQPLRAWILDTKKAKNLASSENYGEMKRFVQKVGTNPVLLDKSVSVSFGEPWDFAASRLAGRALAERRSREAMLPSGSKNSESSCWWSLYQKVRTYFQQNPD